LACAETGRSGATFHGNGSSVRMIGDAHDDVVQVGAGVEPFMHAEPIRLYVATAGSSPESALTNRQLRLPLTTSLNARLAIRLSV
jgi:hypothetical protein